eukprot:6489988-Amphidinium_carterae.1
MGPHLPEREVHWLDAQENFGKAWTQLAEELHAYLEQYHGAERSCRWPVLKRIWKPLHQHEEAWRPIFLSVEVVAWRWLVHRALKIVQGARRVVDSGEPVGASRPCWVPAACAPCK